MKIRYILILAVIAGCGYLPIFDYLVLSDFEEVDYSYSSNEVCLCRDSVSLLVQASVWVPKNARGRSLKNIWVDISLSVGQNLYPKSRIVIFPQNLSLHIEQSNGNELEEQSENRIYSLSDSTFEALALKEFGIVDQGFVTNVANFGSALRIRAFFLLETNDLPLDHTLELVIPEHFASMLPENCTIDLTNLKFHVSR